MINNESADCSNYDRSTKYVATFFSNIRVMLNIFSCSSYVENTCNVLFTISFLVECEHV